MAEVSAQSQSIDTHDNVSIEGIKAIPLNFFDNKIDKVVYFQLSNFLLQVKFISNSQTLLFCLFLRHIGM